VEQMHEPTRAEDEVYDMVVELGWDRAKAREEADKARQRGIPFSEWVRAALAIHRREQRGPEYEVEVEWEKIPCALIYSKIEASHLASGTTLMRRLRQAFPDMDKACEWLRTRNHQLEGRTPADLVLNERFDDVLRVLSSS